MSGEVAAVCSGWDWNTTSFCHSGPIFLSSEPPVYINSDGRRGDTGATEGEMREYHNLPSSL